jgi:putative ABC transport system permease protein
MCHLQAEGGSLKRTFMNSLEPSHLPQAFILVLFAVALSYFYNLRAERDLLESSIRTTVQLLLVGYVLQFVLKVQSFAFLVLILFLMSIFGSITAVERLKLQGSFGRLFLKSYIALVVPSSFVFVLLYLMGYVRKDPVSMITLWGLVLGNSLSNVSLTFERMRSEAFNRIREIEAKVALGAPLKKAMEEVIQNAIRVSMRGCSKKSLIGTVPPTSKGTNPFLTLSHTPSTNTGFRGERSLGKTFPRTGKKRATFRTCWTMVRIVQSFPSSGFLPLVPQRVSSKL